MSIKIPPAILGPEMGGGCENPHAHSIPPFRGGVGVF